MTDLTAIDILIDPDARMVERARAVNTDLLRIFPGGFALDEHHQPHVTLLQRYLRTADLERAFAAVTTVLDTVDLGQLTLTATGFNHLTPASIPGIGLGGIVVQASPEVLDFQARLIAAVAPFTAAGGTADAYVRTPAEPEINDDTIDYIEHYVPDHCGAHYVGHVTIGLATLDQLANLEAGEFEPLTFSPVGLSIYQLGNNGTAARHLTSWAT